MGNDSDISALLIQAGSQRHQRIEQQLGGICYQNQVIILVVAGHVPEHAAGTAVFLVGLALVVVAMGALGFVPLFDGPGYESSLGAGILLGFVVSVSVALSVSAEVAAPIDVLSRGLAVGAPVTLLSAEGAALFMRDLMKQAFKSSPLAIFGGLLAMPALSTNICSL